MIQLPKSGAAQGNGDGDTSFLFFSPRFIIIGDRPRIMYGGAVAGG